MTLAVLTGASGFLGANLAAMLAESGVTVRATKRGSSRVAHLDDVAVEWVDAALDDESALTRAFDGADVVFHVAGVATQTRFKRGQQHAVNVDGTRHVLAAAKRANVGRFVHTSSVVTCAIAKDGAPDVDETVPWNFPEHGLDEMYARTKHEAEKLALAAANELDVVVVNPGTMFGPRDAKPSSGRMILALATGKIFASTRGVSSFVDVRDVCRGMLSAWKSGRRGERYILAGQTLSYKDVFALICAELGVTAPGFTLPDEIVTAAGGVGDLGELLLGRELELNSAIAAYAICRGYRFSSAKAMRELGYALSPLDGAVRDAVAWFRQHGMLPGTKTPKR